MFLVIAQSPKGSACLGMYEFNESGIEDMALLLEGIPVTPGRMERLRMYVDAINEELAEAVGLEGGA